MVVVFGCGGQFDKAISMIKAMPFFEYSAIGISLLGACRKWGNVKLGRLSFDQAIQLDNNGATTYVCMLAIFGSASMLEDEFFFENMIRIKHDSWRKQEYEHAMDVYVNEHTMDAYIDHGWVDRSGGF